METKALSEVEGEVWELGPAQRAWTEEGSDLTPLFSKQSLDVVDSRATGGRGGGGASCLPVCGQYWLGRLP